MTGVASRSNAARLGVGALLLAALALGRVVTEKLPGTEIATRPFETVGALGRPVEVRAFTVTVTDLDGARAIKNTTDEILPSPGVWLVARVTLVATRDAGDVPAYAVVRAADGTLFDSYGRGRTSCALVIPGRPTPCEVRVEVDPARLPGAELLLGPPGRDQSWDEIAVIPLEVDAARVATWTARTDPILVGRLDESAARAAS